MGGHACSSAPGCHITMTDISWLVLWTRYCAEYLTWIISPDPFCDPPSRQNHCPTFADGETEAQSNEL